MISPQASVFLAEYTIWIVLLSPIYLTLRHKKSAALTSACSGFLVWLVGELVKIFFFLPRPFMQQQLSPTISPLFDGSFPSNHTAVSFAIAFSIYQSESKLGLFLLLVSLAVGLGRVMVLVHYPVDVVGGIVLGYLSSVLTRKYLFRH